jgi:hypothetical protein
MIATNVSHHVSSRFPHEVHSHNQSDQASRKLLEVLSRQVQADLSFILRLCRGESSSDYLSVALHSVQSPQDQVLPQLARCAVLDKRLLVVWYIRSLLRTLPTWHPRPRQPVASSHNLPVNGDCQSLVCQVAGPDIQAYFPSKAVDSCTRTMPPPMAYSISSRSHHFESSLSHISGGAPWLSARLLLRQPVLSSGSHHTLFLYPSRPPPHHQFFFNISCVLLRKLEYYCVITEIVIHFIYIFLASVKIFCPSRALLRG